MSYLIVYAFRPKNSKFLQCLTWRVPKSGPQHLPGLLGVAADDAAALGVKPWNPVFRQTARPTVTSAGTACDRPVAFFQSNKIHCCFPQDFSRCLSSAHVYGILCLQAWWALVKEVNPILWSGSGSRVQISKNKKLHLVKIALKKILFLSQLFLKQCFWLEPAPQDKKTRLSALAE